MDARASRSGTYPLMDTWVQEHVFAGKRGRIQWIRPLFHPRILRLGRAFDLPISLGCAASGPRGASAMDTLDTRAFPQVDGLCILCGPVPFRQRLRFGLTKAQVRGVVSFISGKDTWIHAIRPLTCGFRDVSHISFGLRGLMTTYAYIAWAMVMILLELLFRRILGIQGI